MKKGFTLVEMSIVLVIIGLLIGGVLAGQELVGQAKVRKNIGELNNLDRAWKTFSLKYDGLPGDLEDAASFFSVCDGTVSSAPADISGNGNGEIEGDELYCIWTHLAMSGLYNPISPKQDFFFTNYPSADVNFDAGEGFRTAIWPLDMSPNGFSSIQSVTVVGEVNVKPGDYLRVGDAANIISPKDAYSIDSKIDDGKAVSGLLIINDSSSNCLNNLNLGAITQASEYILSETGKECGYIYKLN